MSWESPLLGLQDVLQDPNDPHALPLAVAIGCLHLQGVQHTHAAAWHELQGDTLWPRRLLASREELLVSIARQIALVDAFDDRMVGPPEYDESVVQDALSARMDGWAACVAITNANGMTEEVQDAVRAWDAALRAQLDWLTIIEDTEVLGNWRSFVLDHMESVGEALPWWLDGKTIDERALGIAAQMNYEITQLRLGNVEPLFEGD